MPTALKGWPIFRELAAGLAGDPRYEFLHLGGQAEAPRREPGPGGVTYEVSYRWPEIGVLLTD